MFRFVSVETEEALVIIAMNDGLALDAVAMLLLDDGGAVARLALLDDRSTIAPALLATRYLAEIRGMTSVDKNPGIIFPAGSSIGSSNHVLKGRYSWLRWTPLSIPTTIMGRNFPP